MAEGSLKPHKALQLGYGFRVKGFQGLGLRDWGGFGCLGFRVLGV